MAELFIVFAVFGLLGVVMLFLNALLGPKKTNPAKESPFECGSPYLQSEIKPFSIKFTVIAFIFLLFHVEVVFFPMGAHLQGDEKAGAFDHARLFRGACRGIPLRLEKGRV